MSENSRRLEFRRFHALQLEGAYLLGLQIDYADAMGIGVGDVELAVGGAEAPRFVKHGTGKPAIALAADEGRARALGRVHDLDLAIIRVGHEQLAVVESKPERMLQAH